MPRVVRRDISDTTSAPPPVQSQLGSPQTGADVAEPDHNVVDTHATPPNDS